MPKPDSFDDAALQLESLAVGFLTEFLQGEAKFRVKRIIDENGRLNFFVLIVRKVR